MTRSLLTSLVAFAMLLPQGACLCDLLSRLETSAASQPAQPVEQKGCCCHKHQHTETATKLVHATHSAPVKEHHGGCPEDTGRLKWTSLPGGLFTIDLYVAELPAHAAVAPTLPVACSVEAWIRPDDHPLYLSLLNLRI